MQSIDDVVDIPYFIPPMDDEKSHHVISRGQSPTFYRPEDLKDTATGKTRWVDTFEKMLVGLYLALEAPVPYAFRTPDGAIRSLDAGCIKMLLNRRHAELHLNLGPGGFISSVVPADIIMSRYAMILPRLKERIVSAQAE